LSSVTPIELGKVKKRVGILLLELFMMLEEKSFNNKFLTLNNE
jgi:hypothetical protein